MQPQPPPTQNAPTNAPYPYGAPMQGGAMVPQQQTPQQAQAAKLVRVSTYLGWGGLLLATGGACATGALLQNAALAITCVGLGFALAIAGAIIGQIGRGMQGRVI